MSDSNNGSQGGNGKPGPKVWSRNEGPRIGRIGNSGAGRGGNTGGPRFGSLRDFAKDNDSDDDSDKKEGAELYAGGEKSALSLQNPNNGGNFGRDLAKRLLKKAAGKNGEAEGVEGSSGSGSSTSFRGEGMTLGGEGTESRKVEDPNAKPAEGTRPVIRRNVIMWRNGFSIDDGPLRTYEDPESMRLLVHVQQGDAPPELFGLNVGDDVEASLEHRMNEDYVAPTASSSNAFSGSGQRLGAPTTAPSSSSAAMPGTFEASSATSEPERGLDETIFEVDSTQPTTRINIRFADGTREAVTMNLTHTVADIRNFINFSRRESNSRTYSITNSATFPPRELTDETQTIKDAKLERSVVTQKWT